MKIPEYSPADISPLLQKYTLCHWLVLGCLLAMVTIFTFNNVIRPWGNITVWIIQSAPLLIFIPGIIKHNHRTYSWLCFVLMPYFINTVVNAMASRTYILTFVLLLLIVVLFISAMMASRYRQHYALALQQNPDNHSEKGQENCE